MAARLDLAGKGWHALLAALAVLLGLGAGIDPAIGLAAAIGLAFVVLVLGDLTIGLCLFAIVAFLDVLPHLGGSALSFTKVVGFLLAVSWLAKVSSSDDSRNDFMAAHPTFSYVLALFVFLVALSLTWAEEPGEGTTPLLRYTLNLVLFLIVFTAVRTPKAFMWTVGAYVLGASVAAGYGVLNPPQDVAYYDVTRVGGTIGDPNQLAAILVGGTILAAGLAAALKQWPLLRVAAVGASALCAAGIFLSLSRGGLVALAFALVAAVVVAGRWRAQALTLAAVVAAGAFCYYGFVASHDAIDRVTSFGNGTGRTDIWTVGWRMVKAHPVQGVGAGNFQTASIHYLLEPGAIKRDEFIVDTPKVAHNTYLQVLAELGIVGAVLFISIILFSLLCILRAARLFARLKQTSMELLSRAMLVALTGVLAADFFISEEFSKQLWLLLGLGPALLGIARSLERDPARDGWEGP
ncbi:MAG TPA: O-antigen ligase family protein, partial [Thermoleophilaceae bacterium]